MNNLTLREFICNYENGEYNDTSFEAMVRAGWYDWFCKDTSLKRKLDKLFPKVKQISISAKVDLDKMYVFFKNNCPIHGSLYDDFRICDMETGDVIYTIIPASGHKVIKGQAQVWGRENNFNEALAKGTWKDIKAFFGIEKTAEQREAA